MKIETYREDNYPGEPTTVTVTSSPRAFDADRGKDQYGNAAFVCGTRKTIRSQWLVRCSRVFGSSTVSYWPASAEIETILASFAITKP